MKWTLIFKWVRYWFSLSSALIQEINLSNFSLFEVQDFWVTCFEFNY